jgi:hypothetical protein
VCIVDRDWEAGISSKYTGSWNQRRKVSFVSPRASYLLPGTISRISDHNKCWLRLCQTRRSCLHLHFVRTLDSRNCRSALSARSAQLASCSAVLITGLVTSQSHRSHVTVTMSISGFLGSSASRRHRLQNNRTYCRSEEIGLYRRF